MIDAIAFKELYKTVYQDLYRFALCMMHHPQDAEDAVSEAVLSAYENIHKLRKEEAFRSWIFQILANVCRRKLKSRERTETELKEDHASATYCDGLRTDVERAFLILDEDRKNAKAEPEYSPLPQKACPRKDELASERVG